MGLGLSLLGGDGPPAAPPKVVIVPPMFERDLRSRGRFCKSSYDYLFAKSKARLFNDFLDMHGPVGVLHFSPPADENMSVKARLSMQSSTMTLRYQPLGPSQPNTFFDIKANPAHAQDVAARACFFDPGLGVGVFAKVPLAKRISGDLAEVGVRYSSPELACGAIMTARTGALAKAWLVGRYSGMTMGLQVEPGPGGMPSPASADAMADWLRSHSRWAVSYTPPEAASTSAVAGRNNFTAAMEVVHGSVLLASFHQHFAVNRRVVNPLETSDVVGITNYIDVGLQLATPISHGASGAEAGSEETSARAGDTGPGPAPGPVTSSSSAPGRRPDTPDPGLNLAVAWQANKNWLLKARVGSSSAAACLGLRAWFHPSFMLVGSVQYSYGSTSTGGFGELRGLPLRWGLCLQVENCGAMRYERGAQDLRGRALLQRHEATAADVANFEGTGRLVKKYAMDGDYNEAVSDTTAAHL